MKITFLCNDGSGFAGEEEVPEGTTLISFLGQKMGDVNPNRYMIRVNREIAKLDQVLTPGCRVSCTPLKLEGAKS